MSRSKVDKSGPVVYLDPSTVTGKKRTKPPLNYSRTGYGGKIGTSWMLHIGKKWHRVYVMQYSNAGSAYVIVNKKLLFLGSYDPND